METGTVVAFFASQTERAKYPKMINIFYMYDWVTLLTISIKHSNKDEQNVYESIKVKNLNFLRLILNFAQLITAGSKIFLK